MALKKSFQYEKGPAPLDESWWNAVLEDVEAQQTSRTQPQHPQSKESQKQTKGEAGARQEANPVPEIDWDWVQQLYQEDLVIELEVIDHNRGGLLVRGEHIQGFVPASHLIGLSKKNLKGNRDDLLSPYMGRTLQLKVIECDPERGRIVFSERAAQTDAGSRLELLNTLAVGDYRRGRVTTITDFGVFVDLGGVEGLIHISELSWGRVCHPKDIVSIGEEIEVYILQIDQERARVALSIKRLSPNPWDSIQSRYEPGQVTKAVITNIVSFGAFARLEDGVDGLIHISEFSNRASGSNIEDVVSEGQQVSVYILNIDTDRQRLGLSLNKEEEGAI